MAPFMLLMLPLPIIGWLVADVFQRVYLFIVVCCIISSLTIVRSENSRGAVTSMALTKDKQHYFCAFGLCVWLIFVLAIYNFVTLLLMFS